MRTKKTLTCLALLAICLATLLSLCACTDMDVGNNTALAEQFMDHVLTNDYDAAYGMVKATVSDTDFREYWVGIQTAVEGAGAYEMEQIGWQAVRSGGLTTRTTAYQVYPDNGHTILLRVVTRDDIAGIAGIHFSDVTEFLRSTETFVPTVQVILWVLTGLAIAFTVWMFVDCLRRRMKYKVLWAILILFGVAFTFTVGQSSSFAFHMGLFFQNSSITADPGLQAVVTEVVVPVGAILYLCLRKRFTVTPSESNTPSQPDP